MMNDDEAIEIESGPYALDQIAAAIANAQAEMKNPTFDKINAHFNSKYASLAVVRDAVIPCFAKHGVCVIQDIRCKGTAVSSYILMIHTSGQFINAGPCTIIADKESPHALGSAMTYARKYHLQAVAGVAGEDDDDANAAVDPAAKRHHVKTITAQQALDLEVMANDAGIPVERILDAHRIKKLEDLPAVDLKSVSSKIADYKASHATDA